ncbi:MAG: helix-turn-helix domain-containing protein [Candidatus Altiarchaeales archaeon]|nr:helix-turn-helix domain-containing protein [Candidatus Altiarchaeales archaeon]MBD3417339.1 helix-turn-helix domain-containing protein [Candidatus Altiarchaeales archaeon]
MKLPCETALWYVLPQIRADLSRALVKEGMSQKEVADVLGITPAAVSQYIHKKRGGKIKRTKEYNDLVRDSAKKILKSKDDVAVRGIICRCCAVGQKSMD